MKGFYSPIDRLMEQSTRPRGTGAEYMAELSKRPGYKPQEAEDRNLQTLMALPKMERAAFMAELKAKPAVMPEESTFAKSILKNRGLNVVPDTEPYHEEDYTLPGGTNYREILLQHPKGTFPGVPEHFGGAPNVLASIRAKDRIGPNGEKILHLEEIQSDWHQQGREKGYKPKAINLNKTLDTVKKKYNFLHRQLYDAKANAKESEQRKAEAINPEEQALHDRMLQKHQRSIMDLMPQVMRADDELHKTLQLASKGVPDAPFKKDWHELALKKMIHHAAMNGYDQIAITPGAEQADRYGLSKHVSRITHMTHLDNPDSGILFAFDPTGRQIVEKHNIPHAELPEYIGKEGAQKLLAQKPDETGYRELSSQNLEVGGEGMKGFYDRMVPAFLNKFGKKYGSQVQPGTIETRQYTPNDRSLRQLAGYSTPVAETAPVHMFNITPQMREDVVKNGIPLYAEGGGVHMAGGGDPKKESLKDRLKWAIQESSKHSMYSSLLDAGYGIYKYKTGTFPLENAVSDLEYRLKPFPIDTGSVPMGTQFNSIDFDSSELNKNLKPVQRRAKGGKVEVKPTVKDDAIQRKVPEMEAAAKALQAGAITREDYDKVVRQHKPVKPYTFVPKPASDEDADRALMENKKPQWRGHEQWPAGRKVGLRLDIPAYEHHGVWVNSVHDEEGSGKDKYPTAYHSVSSVKNATFDASPEKAVRVATGEQNKSPFARIKGELHHMSEDEAVEHMKAHLDHPDYVQVGMDPRRHGFFYDRKTMKPVTSSAHVVQIGPLVLAHKPTYGKRETYAKGGNVSRGTIKGKVTISPNMDVMQYELLNRKAK